MFSLLILHKSSMQGSFCLTLYLPLFRICTFLLREIDRKSTLINNNDEDQDDQDDQDDHDKIENITMRLRTHTHPHAQAHMHTYTCSHTHARTHSHSHIHEYARKGRERGFRQLVSQSSEVPIFFNIIMVINV